VFGELANYARKQRHHVVLDSRFGVEQSSAGRSDKSHALDSSTSQAWQAWFASSSAFDSSTSSDGKSRSRSEVTQRVFRVLHGNPEEFRENVPRHLGGAPAVFAGTVLFFLLLCVVILACCVTKREYSFIGQ
jgi:hypothetical protein